MTRYLSIFIFSFLIIISCTKKEPQKEIKLEPDEIGKKYFQEGISALEEGDFFYASKIFSDAETNFLNIEMAAKSSILSSYSFYRINFYNESSQNLKRFLRTYPASKYIPYANYLLTIISFEQIVDEKKDLTPPIDTKKKIDNSYKLFNGGFKSITAIKIKIDFIKKDNFI